MNTNKLREVIKAIVKEEINEILPDLITKVLVENLTGGKKSTKPDVSRTLDTPKKEVKKYTNNELLNKALNETVNKIPANDPIMLMRESMTSEFVTETSPEQLHNKKPLTEEVKKVTNVINRDFRAVMKEIDNKKKSGNLISSPLVRIES